MTTVVLLGTGSPLPDPHRAGPSTLVRAGTATLLVDAGRGVSMRLAAAGSSPAALTAVLLTHLHSDHVTDLSDLITTRWVTTFEPSPLRIIGPPGTSSLVATLLTSLELDIGYRTAHHDDLHGPPPVEVQEVQPSQVLEFGDVRVAVGATDHRPVTPTVGYRIEHEGRAVVVAGDTVPCPSLDELTAGADALVITAIQASVLRDLGVHRLRDVTDYHSSIEEAAQTAARAGVRTLVLTHYVPAPTTGTEQDWAAPARAHFAGDVVAGPDLTTVTV